MHVSWHRASLSISSIYFKDSSLPLKNYVLAGLYICYEIELYFALSMEWSAGQPFKKEWTCWKPLWKGQRTQMKEVFHFFQGNHLGYWRKGNWLNGFTSKGVFPMKLDWQMKAFNQFDPFEWKQMTRLIPFQVCEKTCVTPPLRPPSVFNLWDLWVYGWLWWLNQQKGCCSGVKPTEMWFSATRTGVHPKMKSERKQFYRDLVGI